MQPHVIQGTKQEIADRVARMPGEVLEAIIFVAEPATRTAPTASDVDDIFAEMQPYMVDVDDVDDSREAIYTRMDGE